MPERGSPQEAELSLPIQQALAWGVAGAHGESTGAILTQVKMEKKEKAMAARAASVPSFRGLSWALETCHWLARKQKPTNQKKAQKAGVSRVRPDVNDTQRRGRKQGTEEQGHRSRAWSHAPRPPNDEQGGGTKRRSRLGMMELGWVGHREGRSKASRCTGKTMERGGGGQPGQGPLLMPATSLDANARSRIQQPCSDFWRTGTRTIVTAQPTAWTSTSHMCSFQKPPKWSSPCS